MAEITKEQVVDYLSNLPVIQIAELVKETRERDFRERNESGAAVNHVTTMACLGGATMDNEENYLIKKLFGGGLGLVSIENQARI